MIDIEYIILNDKTPTHKFKTSETTKTLDEVKDFDNFGVIVPKGYLVLDFDTVSDAEIMLDIVQTLKLKTRVMKTTRGYHFWFKNEGIEKNFIKSRLAIGIFSDCKNSNARAYVKLKDKGKMREWITKTPFKEIENVPKWLTPISAPSDKFRFKDMTSGDGRNQELFNYIVYLQTKGFSKDEIKDTINVINDFVFKEPLPEYEIEQITRDDAFKPEEEIREHIIQTKGFKHNEFGDQLIDTFNIITLNEQIYIYEDGYYQQDERIIERRMIELYPGIKQRERGEVLAYIRIQTHKSANDIKVNPYIINLKNTRYDLKTGNLLNFTPNAIEFDRIPVTYDPMAYNADLDKMLNRVFLGDKEVMNLFEEMVGYTLLKHSRYRAGFMFYGSGKNGKSTILNMLKHFLGVNNYTTIELDKLTDRFTTAELEHKLANIGDDINDRAIKDTGTIKKLFTGESLLVERKGERPFILEPYAKMIFSMNNIPKSYDRSDGFYSRLMFIPFNAKFEADDEDFDPHIADKVMSDEAMSYLLNRAIKGVQRLMTRGEFTSPKVVEQAMKEYKKQNSIVLQWASDQDIDIDYLTEKTKDEIYSKFDDWCINAGVRGHDRLGKIKFYNEVEYQFGLTTQQRREPDGERRRYFVVDIG
ncbi:hypothetical protein E4P35_12075 [Thiopseudomonas sp. 4R-3cl]|nr:hypothetical protein E4P35_12075 [Thiopseudomonas sp. 4R-3cl]